MFAQILATNPDVTFQDLLDFSSHMDAKQEDLFWKEVNGIRGYTY